MLGKISLERKEDGFNHFCKCCHPLGRGKKGKCTLNNTDKKKWMNIISKLKLKNRDFSQSKALPATQLFFNQAECWRLKSYKKILEIFLFSIWHKWGGTSIEHLALHLVGPRFNPSISRFFKKKNQEAGDMKDSDTAEPRPAGADNNYLDREIV